jgi:WD40 repeat protein
MKKSIFLIAFLLLSFSNSLWAESDTLWTKYIGSTVRTVKFSPDGRFVYAAVEGRSPLKLDANTGEILMEYQGFTYSDYSFNNAIDISSDGKMLIGGDFHNLYIFDTETGKVIDSLESDTKNYEYNRFNEVLFAQDDNYVVACLNFGETTTKPYSNLLIWDYKTKKIIQKKSGYRIVKLAINQTNTTLAYIYGSFDSDDFDINLLEIGTWKNIGLLKGHTSRITDLSFSPDGSLLASCGSSPYIVNIWDLNKKELILGFKPNGTYTYCIELLSSNLLASSSGDWEKIFVRSSDINTKKEVYSTQYYARDINFFKNEKAILASSDKLILLNADKLSTIPFHIGKDKLFPNPAYQNLTIPKSYFNENFIYFNIIDMTGKEVYRYNKNFNFNFNEDLLVDVSRYLRGSYIVQFFYTTNIQTLKFIKE